MLRLFGGSVLRKYISETICCLISASRVKALPCSLSCMQRTRKLWNNFQSCCAVNVSFFHGLCCIDLKTCIQEGEILYKKPVHACNACFEFTLDKMLVKCSFSRNTGCTSKFMCRIVTGIE